MTINNYWFMIRTIQENLITERGMHMNVEPAVRGIIKNRGLRQTWVVEQMNRVDPNLSMSKAKLSAVVCGNRAMTGDELIAFCMATGVSPDYFCVAAGQDSA